MLLDCSGDNAYIDKDKIIINKVFGLEKTNNNEKTLRIEACYKHDKDNLSLVKLRERC